MLQRRLFGSRRSVLLLALASVLLVFGVGMSMAFASSQPAHSALTDTMACHPSDPHLGGGCEITFNARDEPEGYGYGYGYGPGGQQVCFTSSVGADQVLGESGNCSLTDSTGKAYAVLSVRSCQTVTVTGTEAAEQNGVIETVRKAVVLAIQGCTGAG
jgi:hypothetical protein